MYQTNCIPQDVEAQSQADFVSLCYTYNFLGLMSGIINDCADRLPIAPKTQDMLRQIAVSFSSSSVYLYQVLERGQQYEGMRLPELGKWPSITLLGEGWQDDFYEEELKPKLGFKLNLSRKPKRLCGVEN